MPQRKATVERLAAFSDGVFAVLITVMVLDLRPPEHPIFADLLPLWPTALSYVVSYQFIAIVWLNHHHLLQFTDEPTPRLIWINFAHLLMVSLVPFSTAWVARTRLAAVPVFIYATVFVLVELAYLQFEHHALAHAVFKEVSHRTRRLAKIRSFTAFGLFLSAMLLSPKFPHWGFALICCAVLLYLRPEIPEAHANSADKKAELDESQALRAKSLMTSEEHVIRNHSESKPKK
jgi:TMEM175 potassium channel family protein